MQEKDLTKELTKEELKVLKYEKKLALSPLTIFIKELEKNKLKKVS